MLVSGATEKSSALAIRQEGGWKGAGMLLHQLLTQMSILLSFMPTEALLASVICPLGFLAELMILSPVFYLLGGRRPWAASWFPVKPSLGTSLSEWGIPKLGKYRLQGLGSSVFLTYTSHVTGHGLGRVTLPGFCLIVPVMPLMFSFIPLKAGVQEIFPFIFGRLHHHENSLLDSNHKQLLRG